ncbi:MAG: hypothetical protein V1663_04430 [archaeon]
MATDISSLFYSLQQSGFYEFILPFLLVFAIVFAVLDKTKIFGEEKRNINAIVAILFGLLFVSQAEIIDRMNLFLPKISFFLIIILMVLILFGVLGVPVGQGLGPLLLIVGAIVSVVAVYWALGPTLGFEVPYWVEDNWTTVVFGAILLIVIFAIISPGSGERKSLKDRTETLSDLLFGSRRK